MSFWGTGLVHNPGQSFSFKSTFVKKTLPSKERCKVSFTKGRGINGFERVMHLLDLLVISHLSFQSRIIKDCRDHLVGPTHLPTQFPVLELWSSHLRISSHSFHRLQSLGLPIILQFTRWQSCHSERRNLTWDTPTPPSLFTNHPSRTAGTPTSSHSASQRSSFDGRSGTSPGRT